MSEEKTTAQYLEEDAIKLDRYGEMEWAIRWAANQITMPLWRPSDQALKEDGSPRAEHLLNIGRFERVYGRVKVDVSDERDENKRRREAANGRSEETP